MMMASPARTVQMHGTVTALLIPRHGFYSGGLPADLPIGYRLRTLALELRLRLRLAWLGLWRGLLEGSGVLAVGRLYASVLRRDGTVEHLGLVSTKLITDAGVAYIVDDWDAGATEIANLNYHGCGTGVNAEAAGDTTLQTECTTALDPDSTRATGTKSQPTANQIRSVGTSTYDAITAVTEHGLFSQAATGGGTLWDRSVFAAINVGSGDSIQWTYTATLSSGG